MIARFDDPLEALSGTSRRPPWPIILIAATIGCIGVAVPMLTEARGSGATDLALRFLILDAETSAPVASATIRVHGDRRGAVGDRAETSSAGEASIRRRFPIEFSSGSLISRARSIVVFDQDRVDVSAPGYTPTQGRLSALIGRSWDLKAAPFGRAAVVRLRGPADP